MVQQGGERAVAGARLGAQLLAGPPARSVDAVVDRVLAVQAQDPRGFRLAVRSRSEGLVAADVDAALDARRLVVTWLNRGTLHLVAPDDYWWLHPLTTPQLATGNRRRLRQEGVSEREAGRGVAMIADAVAADGPQTRDQLRDRLDAAGVPTARQALVHLLLAASLAGQIVRGPMIGAEHAYVSVRDWLGPAPDPLDADDALARLARRYLAGHGPAGAADLAKWAGVTLGTARRAFAVIVDEVAPFSDELVVLADRAPRPAPPAAPPRLLGAFDPLLHGWRSRELFVAPHTGVVTSNGIFRPCALVNGRVVATWGIAGGVVSIRTLEPIAARARTALVADAARVLHFFGLPDRAPLIE